MTTNKRKLTTWQTAKPSLLPVINGLLSIALLGWGIWYITKELNLGDVKNALAAAKVIPIVLALGTILFTLLLKAWRWQLLFQPKAEKPPLSAAFWAMMLGQFVNTAVSFLRIGEVARVYALQQQTGLSKVRSLGTLVVEKSLELLALLITLIVILPFAIVPDVITHQGATLGILTAVLITALLITAYQTPRIIKLLEWLAPHLPQFIASRLIRWGTAGLEGLASLKNIKTLLPIIATTALIALSAITTPWVLFAAFGLPFGPVEAALIHLITTVASVLPVPIPARLGFFEAAVIFMLTQLQISNDAVSLSYALVFHLVVILPQIILGALAASRTNWHWQKTLSTLDS